MKKAYVFFVVLLVTHYCYSIDSELDTDDVIIPVHTQPQRRKISYLNKVLRCFQNDYVRCNLACIIIMIKLYVDKLYIDHYDMT